MKASAQDIRLAAVYRFAAKRRLAGEDLCRLIHQRARLPEQSARQLAAHWLTTGPFKNAAQESIRG